MDIQITKDNGILTIGFNREEKKNAITAAMYQQLADAIKDAETDNAVRAILFTGKPQAFSAGNDLEDFLKNPPNSKEAPVFKFLWEISHASKPVVAAVSGVAVGIGTTLLLHCDLVYAADNAKFSMPFTQLGLCPEAASSLLLPHLVGYQRAAEKLLLGEAFDAAEARDMGIVNRVLTVEELLPYAQKQAAKLAALPASSIRVTKQLMKKNRVAATETQMAVEIDHFAKMLTAPEAKEAFTAFFEKRKPDFTKFV
ncbi:enoyl-CoA hydratase/carnithine racemase [Herbaspirillum sp. CF444]|uniref:enoyl-CoA hydratase n=1 Tax=Herbaspirillum sp. CF444 TaxID=1144319 RepID=UPI00027245C9|nr:enoyl-CoA hydratase [Herbaspirillum sp. CF444]EJL91972.1 enoyl-CoA hydratase/carnithine racemase [Herbaspirillum sp. CF444]